MSNTLKKLLQKVLETNKLEKVKVKEHDTLYPKNLMKILLEGNNGLSKNIKSLDLRSQTLFQRPLYKEKHDQNFL